MQSCKFHSCTRNWQYPTQSLCRAHNDSNRFYPIKIGDSDGSDDELEEASEAQGDRSSRNKTAVREELLAIHLLVDRMEKIRRRKEVWILI